MRSTFGFCCMLALAVSWAGGVWAKDIRELDSNMAAKAADDGMRWFDAKSLTLEGQGWTDTAHPYDRLPARAEGKVPGPVWTLSQNSAGIAVRFVTDATKIAARWELTSKNLGMAHMAATGVSGVDLYARVNGQWRWAGVGKPEKEGVNTVTLVQGVTQESREYLLYLPLYNGVTQVAIGVPAESNVTPGPARPAGHDKPIVVYGTSIIQGGCATRTGMAHVAILGRQLDRPVINLGFSGNGRMEPELAQLLTELDASVYVLDSTPNMTPEQITERFVPFVHTLRAAKPEIPIVIVEHIYVQSAVAFPAFKAGSNVKNEEIRKAYATLVGEGTKKLYYLPAEAFFGPDGEGTVDGVHPTDLGFLRMADALCPLLKTALGE